MLVVVFFVLFQRMKTGKWFGAYITGKYFVAILFVNLITVEFFYMFVHICPQFECSSTSKTIEWRHTMWMCFYVLVQCIFIAKYFCTYYTVKSDFIMFFQSREIRKYFVALNTGNCFVVFLNMPDLLFFCVKWFFTFRTSIWTWILPMLIEIRPFEKK